MSGISRTTTNTTADTTAMIPQLLVLLLSLVFITQYIQWLTATTFTVTGIQYVQG